MRYLVLLLLTVFLFPLTAQRKQPPAKVNQRWLRSQDTTYQADIARLSGQPYVTEGISLHVMPLSFINGFSRFRFGVQHKWPRWSLLLDLETGSDFTQGVVSNTNQANYSFRGIRPELRYFPASIASDFYVGLELPVSHLRRRVSGSFDNENGARRRADNVLQERWRYSLIAKAGVQLIVWQHMLLDLYVGVGGAQRHLEYSGGTIGPSQQEDGWFVFDVLSRAGTTTVIDLAAGVRVGYWFGRKQ